MKPILVSIYSIISIFCNAQNYRAIYEFEFKKDSLSKDYEKLFMILDINKSSTKFYYNKLLKYDSLYRKGIQLSYTNSLQQLVKRKRDTNKNNNFVYVQDKYFVFTSNDEIDWKIKDSIKIKNSYQLQMAEAEWAGRKWIAWFALGIPIPEGPYKFRGLPGLIMEIQDNKKNFYYSLLSFEKKNAEYDTHNILESNFGSKPLEISFDIYKKLLLDNYNNPFAEYQNKEDNGNWGLEYSGKEIKTKAGLKEIMKEYRLDIKKNNNPIELDKKIDYN